VLCVRPSACGCNVLIVQKENMPKVSNKNQVLQKIGQD
jgi:hypothetical protein